MDFEEFWEVYRKEDVTTISDLVIEQFKQGLSDDILEKYDIGEILVDFVEQQEFAKNFEAIEKIAVIVKNKYPALYESEREFINDALVFYYCFIGDRDNLILQVEDTIGSKYDYDLFISSYKCLLYNGYVGLVNRVVESEYKHVQNNADFIEGADFELAMAKYYIELEQLYLEQKGHLTPDISTFANNIHEYGFDLDPVSKQYIEIGVLGTSTELFSSFVGALRKNQSELIVWLDTKFLLYMKERNVPFVVTGHIFYYLCDYFASKKAKTWKSYFTIEKNTFKRFINHISNFFSINICEKAAVLWGSSYFLDFLYESGIIIEKNYLQQKRTVDFIKDKIKQEHQYDLWRLTFIHQWLPAEMIDVEDWEEEKKTFKATYGLEIEPQKVSFEELDRLFEKDLSFNPPVVKPIVSGEKKIGRNEKVTVKYLDGTIQHNIKYKKVERDIKEGNCEII